MAQKIRIKDIARLAGVSAGTVDRVLHNRGNVSTEARRAIEAVFREVDYRPNIHRRHHPRIQARRILGKRAPGHPARVGCL